MGVGLEGQVSGEVGCQLYENLFLAAEQASGGIGHRWASGREIDAVERESNFQFNLFRRRGWRLQFDAQFAIRRAATAVVDMAIHGVASGGQTGSFEAHGGVTAADSPAA